MAERKQYSITAALASNTNDKFKSPNTVTLAQWEKMRVALPAKIDEVMASFRDSKLELGVHAHDDDTELPWLSEDIEEVPQRPWLRIFLFGMLIGVALLAAMYYWMEFKRKEVDAVPGTLDTPVADVKEAPPALLPPAAEVVQKPANEVAHETHESRTQEPETATEAVHADVDDPLKPLFQTGVARSRTKLKAPDELLIRRHARGAANLTSGDEGGN